MPKFTLIAEHEDFDGKVEGRLTSEFRAETWDDALIAFEEFLRGSGYYFDGHFALVDENDKPVSKVDEFDDSDFFHVEI